jgi:superfamily II DNA or RNA helicase
MQIVKNKALLLKVRDPQKILSTIPCSQQVGDHEVLVRWGLEEAQVLKNLRVKDVPSPILRTYDWPGMHKPFAHQITTAEFLTLHRRAFCFNSQGTGKTASVIWAADYLIKTKRIRRVLVICPVSIMGSAWRGDLFRFAMHRTFDIAHNSRREQRIKVIESGVEFVIINYDGLDIVSDAILDDGRFDLIVVDECFVAGTLVSTPAGRRPIEQLAAGDEVLTSDGVMRIKRLVRNTTKRLVEVKLGNNQTIRCTPEHPFFTDAGWVCAKNLAGRRLISGVELSCLRAGVSPSSAPGVMGYGKQPTNWVDLLKILRTEEMALSESQQELLYKNASRATGQTIRAEDTGTQGEVVHNRQSAGAQATHSQREWYGHDSGGAVDFRGLACGVGMELPGSVGQAAAGLSYKLQAGLRVAQSQNRVGGGREQPQGGVPTGAGQEEGIQAGGAWVESVSYIECPRGEDVFNIEVEGTPNYFIGDHWLVHNCNAYKNVHTKRWKTLVKLIKPQTWVWMLTGTPASQEPADAFGLAKIVNPSGVPKFYGAFRDMVMQQITRFKWVPKPNATDTVFRVLQPAIRFSKEECLDLPDVLHVTRDVPLTAQQEKYYTTLLQQQLMVAAGEEISAPTAATVLSKLLQISGGAVYSDTKEVIEFDCSNRLQALREVIDEASHKVLVFVPYTHSLKMVSDWLTKEGYSNQIINGGVPPNKRTEIFNTFQTTPEPRVLVIQPQAASHGVTLHAANVIVYWTPVMSVETYLQANARVHRAGQVNKVTIVHLQGSRVESKMYKMLQSKVDTHQRLVDLYKEEMLLAANPSLQPEELQALKDWMK